MSNNPDSLHYGIVLYNYQAKKSKIVVFDSNLGKIQCIVFKLDLVLKLHPGSYISYNISKKNFYYSLSEIDILAFPDYWVKNNFLFFHHALELCYYFLPLDCPAHPVFNLIKILYYSPETVNTNYLKKLFLCQFFSKLDMYPCEETIKNKNILDLLKISLDNKINFDVNLDMELNHWLLSCINLYSGSYSFKTINFLKELSIS